MLIIWSRSSLCCLSSASLCAANIWYLRFSCSNRIGRRKTDIRLTRKEQASCMAAPPIYIVSTLQLLVIACLHKWRARICLHLLSQATQLITKNYLATPKLSQKEKQKPGIPPSAWHLLPPTPTHAQTSSDRRNPGHPSTGHGTSLSTMQTKASTRHGTSKVCLRKPYDQSKCPMSSNAPPPVSTSSRSTK